MIFITHLIAENPERLAGPLLADTYVTLLKGRNAWYAPSRLRYHLIICVKSIWAVFKKKKASGLSSREKSASGLSSKRKEDDR
jgi:hypothetical protein